MRRLWPGVLCVLAACCVGGCVSRRGATLDQVLEGLGSEEPAGREEYVGPDAPEAPGSSLPAPPPGPESAEFIERVQEGLDIPGGEITIQPDCLLQIRVSEDATLDGNYPVNDIGAVQLGYIGPVILYNKTETQAARKISQILQSRDFRHATVSVRILRASYDRVRVAGAVNRQGVIRIGAGDAISLNDALLRAGGLKPSAGGSRVKIVRGGLLSALAFALEGEEYSLVTEDGKPDIPGVSLRNNDVAYVFKGVGKASMAAGGKEILVLGEVARQGLYRFSGAEPCTIMHLVFKMGGLPPYANRKALRILRLDEEGNEKEIRVNVDRIMDDGNPDDDVALENGDRVVVPARRISLF